MKLINGIEGKILKKYIKEKEPEDKDKNYIEKMLLAGLMTRHYSLKTNKEYVKTTTLGRNCIIDYNITDCLNNFKKFVKSLTKFWK